MGSEMCIRDRFKKTVPLEILELAGKLSSSLFESSNACCFHACFPPLVRCCLVAMELLVLVIGFRLFFLCGDDKAGLCRCESSNVIFSLVDDAKKVPLDC